MDTNDYIMWLSRSFNQNSKKVYYILNEFKTPENAFRANRSEFLKLKGIKPEKADLLIRNRDLIKSWKEELRKSGVTFISVFDKRYPSKLRNIYLPPAGIYVKGKKLIDNDTVTVSIIGSRRCSEYGRRMAAKFAGELSSLGVCIISGMAAGIDSIANAAALEHGGFTAAVLGFGHNCCYPAENRGLMDKIAENGCLISEYPPDTEPEPYYFPKRNNIIAGLSDGVLVVEASKKSGALITADLACQYGRDVMAVPSNITSPNGVGTNNLIKQGCAMITCTEDILFELGYKIINKKSKTGDSKSSVSSKTTDNENKILSLIGSEPVSFEYIAGSTGFAVGDLQSALLMLELKNIIEKLPGDRFVRK